MNRTGYHWSSNSSHGGLLRKLQEFGGLRAIPDDVLHEILKWMVLCYIGEPGGYGMGINRRVFFSNSGAPLVAAIIQEAPEVAAPVLAALGSDETVQRACRESAHVARRYQELLDLAEE